MMNWDKIYWGFLFGILGLFGLLVAAMLIKAIVMVVML